MQQKNFTIAVLVSTLKYTKKHGKPAKGRVFSLRLAFALFAAALTGQKQAYLTHSGLCGRSVEKGNNKSVLLLLRPASRRILRCPWQWCSTFHIEAALKRSCTPAVLPSWRDNLIWRWRGYLQVCRGIHRMWFVDMQQPMFSIIIPIYNAEKHLPVCLDSIIAADIEKAELLLIDDGSTDGSAGLCQKYGKQHPCIRYIHQANLGPSAARNRGLQAASGKYIAFFDSDDYIAPDAFCKTVSLLGQFPDAELWVSDFHRVADNGCVLDRVYQIDDTGKPMEGIAYLYKFLKRRDCVWNVWRYIFRRDFLIRNNLSFIEGVNCAEDLEFAIRALTRAKNPCFFHNPYYSYRVNYGDTLTRKYTAERMKQLMEMLQCSAKYLNSEDSDVGKLLLNKLHQEYLLNLALLQEIPAAERPQAGRFLREAAWIAPLANRWDLKLFSQITSLLGINAASQITYRLKRAKRKIRGAKTALYGRMMGAKALWRRQEYL